MPKKKAKSTPKKPATPNAKAAQARRPTNPRLSFTVITAPILNWKDQRREYDIVQDPPTSKHGFLTLTFHTDIYKEAYKTSFERYTGEVIHPPPPLEKQSSVVPNKEGLLGEASGDGQEHSQLSGSQVPAKTSGDSNLVDSVTDDSAALTVSLKVPGRQDEIGAELTNQSLHTTDEATPESGSKITIGGQQPRVPAERYSVHAIDELQAQGPVTSLAAAQAQREGDGWFAKQSQERLRLDTAQAVTQKEARLLQDKENEYRGIKRSWSPEPPSLTSGAPSATSAPPTPSSPFDNGPVPNTIGQGRPRQPQALSKSPRPSKIVTFKFPKGYYLNEVKMAPVRDPTDVSNKIKDVIQNLFDVQSQTHGFVPETQNLLIDKMAELTESLADLQRLADRDLSPNNPVHKIDLAPEIVDYVDDGRNPDIFTRDFVELVQRGNAVVNGKKQAFRDFSQVYAKALKEGIGGVEKGVDMVMENAGIELDAKENRKAG